MFTEELDRVRLQLHDTQAEVLLRDRKISDLQQDIRDWEIRFNQQGQMLKQVEAEWKDLNVQSSDLRRRVDQISILELQANDALDKQRTAEKQAVLRGEMIESLKETNDEIREAYSEANAAKIRLEAEISPFRNLISALKAKAAAEAAITENLVHLRE